MIRGIYLTDFDWVVYDGEVASIQTAFSAYDSIVFLSFHLWLILL